MNQGPATLQGGKEKPGGVKYDLAKSGPDVRECGIPDQAQAAEWRLGWRHCGFATKGDSSTLGSSRSPLLIAVASRQQRKDGTRRRAVQM